MGGNWVVAPDGYIWKARSGLVVKVDPETGQYREQYLLQHATRTYGSAVSKDGNYFAGGGWPTDWVVLLDMRTGKVTEIETRTRNQGPGRGAFDPFGNGWFGGKGGALVKIDPKTLRVKEYFAPTIYGSYYEANADKNGEIWAVQAKCYSPDYQIKKTDVDSFLSESDRPEIDKRLLIATTDRIGSNAQRPLDNTRPRVVRGTAVAPAPGPYHSRHHRPVSLPQDHIPPSL